MNAKKAAEEIMALPFDVTGDARVQAGDIVPVIQQCIDDALEAAAVLCEKPAPMVAWGHLDSIRTDIRAMKSKEADAANTKTD